MPGAAADVLGDQATDLLATVKKILSGSGRRQPPGQHGSAGVCHELRGESQNLGGVVARAPMKSWIRSRSMPPNQVWVGVKRAAVGAQRVVFRVA